MSFKMATALLIISLAASTNAMAAKGGSHSTRGYVTKKGTYVPPHRATNPDSTKYNNWSQKGNTNPYPGKEGTMN